MQKENQLVSSYAYGKLNELVYEVFIGLEPARKKLSDNLHFIGIISPSDFKKNKHQKLWKKLQKSLLGKTKNIGSQKFPDERLTVQNKTLEFALNSILSIYEECSNRL